MSMSDADLTEFSQEDLAAAVIHLEDLDIFVGQRSRMHPGPGWAVALALIRQDLAQVKVELRVREAEMGDIGPADAT